MKTLDDIKQILSSMCDEPDCDLGWIVDFLTAQGLLMVWQPMETAPKDGTPVLLICDEVERDVGNPYKPIFPVSAYFDQEKWYINDTVYYSAEAVNPTAWMPLPRAGE